MPTKTLALSLLSSLLALSSIGCGPTWVVVRQANPNPMVGQQAFAIQQLSYENLFVGDKPEAAWLAGKEPKAVESFNTDKADSIPIFFTALDANLRRIGAQMVPGPGPGVFLVRPRVTNYEPGSFNGFFDFPTTVKMSVQFMAPNGALLDEVNFSGVIPADLYHPSSGQRMRSALGNIGRQIALYLRTRITPSG